MEVRVSRGSAVGIEEEVYMRLFIARRITLYRPQYVMGVSPAGFVIYELGDLRARIGFIRIPILWALDHISLLRAL